MTHFQIKEGKYNSERTAQKTLFTESQEVVIIIFTVETRSIRYLVKATRHVKALYKIRNNK